MLNYTMSKKQVYHSLMFGLFSKDENSTCQTGKVTYNFIRLAVLTLALVSGQVLKENPARRLARNIKYIQQTNGTNTSQKQWRKRNHLV